jgi:hypothetical protein
MPEVGDKPLWAKCVKCAHCWPVAYLPISVSILAKIGKGGFRCPKCGDGKPVVAKQDNGVLLETDEAA